jgi:hypothetical protein
MRKIYRVLRVLGKALLYIVIVLFVIFGSLVLAVHYAPGLFVTDNTTDSAVHQATPASEPKVQPAQATAHKAQPVGKSECAPNFLTEKVKKTRVCVCRYTSAEGPGRCIPPAPAPAPAPAPCPPVGWPWWAWLLIFGGSGFLAGYAASTLVEKRRSGDG